MTEDSTMVNLQHQDRIRVERDGEEIEVFNWVNISQPSVVRGIGSIETFDARIGAGDSGIEPEAVTEWVAEELWNEFGIEVEKHGIEVIDPTDDGVTVL